MSMPIDRKSLGRLAALLAATASLAGCAVGPDYVRPRAELPASFRNAPSTAPEADLATWWRGFGDALLDRIVEQTLAENLDLAQALARVEQARAATGIARAALLPSGQLSASSAVAHQSAETPLGQIQQAFGAGRNGELHEADIGASWELDLFGGLRRGREAALADYQAADAGAAAARVAVVAEAADTYVLIRALQARLAVAREAADARRRLLGLAQLQFSRGLIAEAQLHQAESAASATEAQVPQLESALEQATNALEVLMGAPSGSWHARLAAPAEVPAAPAIATAEGPASLLRRRPDVIVAERRLAAANARIGTAIAEYYPHFSLSALFGFASTSSASLLGSGAAQAQGVAGVRWRLFDFGRVDAEVAAARGRYAEALAAYRLALLQATADVENAFTDLAKRQEQARLQASGEESLEHARQSALRAHAEGAVSMVEVLDADLRLLRARDDRIAAQSDTARAAVASFRALGGGWRE